jgi:hypothetical protein
VLTRLAACRVRASPFSRPRLFGRLSRGEPSLWTGFPVQGFSSNAQRALDAIRSGFPRDARARVRAAPGITYMSVASVARRWERAEGLFNVPDLHYVGTRFDRRVDTRALNDFNLLRRGTEGFQSQDSLVLSSYGAWADSHSDDHSGSNHCFVGRKLWLMWDTLEGLYGGLEDVERCTVRARAAFDLEVFARLRSARWLIIEPGQTLFLPGHLSHKVVTLERYIGLGSFFAAMPSYVDALIRWSVMRPVWADAGDGRGRCSVDHVNEVAIRRILAVKASSGGEQRRWGLPWLLARLRRPGRWPADGPAAGRHLRALAEVLRA